MMVCKGVGGGSAYRSERECIGENRLREQS